MTATGARWVPGVVLALLAAAVAWGVHVVVPALPWLTVALLLGVVTGCIPALRPRLDGGALKPGLAIASRRMLRLGIVVLGLQVSLLDIGRLGWVAIVGIALLVVAAFAATYGIGRALRLPGDEPVLLAAGFSICGVSAIGALAGARRSSESDQAAPITMVTLCGTAAIVVLPALAPLLGLGGADLGDWIGASVHDVGQVVATASIGGATVLAAAVVVKLTRVLMLAPMVAVASIAARRREARAGAPARDDGDAAGGRRAPIVPLFVAGFLAAVLVRTVVPLPEPVLDVAGAVQSALLAAALFAIGAGLRLERLVRTGGRTLVAALLSWVAILGLALVWLVAT